MATLFKRYCKTLELESDSVLISEYKRLHAMGETWPEISAGMREVGIIDMEIYISGTTLFMIMDTVADFDHNRAMARLGSLPRQSEWEATVSRFQKSSAETSAGEKWRLIERIYKLDQKMEQRAEDGYLEEIS